MGSNMKIAAERLLKIADELEKEAAENTFFVCDGCNHTSSLADINAKRKTAAVQHKVKRVANVSVNDSVTCLACGGKMSYVPTDMSDKYYVEAENEEDTGADIFEPVDEQGKDETSDETPDTAETDETPVVDETVTETTDTPDGDETVTETDETTEAPEGDTAEETTDEISDYDGNPEEDTSEETDMTEDTQDTPESDNVEESPESDVGDTSFEDESTPSEGEMPEGESGSEKEPVEEETVTEDTEETPMGDETSEDEEEGVDLPKKDVPKFEKIPKDASDPFWKSVAKYTI